MKWSGDKPSAPGWWWVWTPDFPCRGRAACVLVEKDLRGLAAWVPYMDYTDQLGADTWDEALWWGPVTPPPLPNIQ